MTMAPGSLMSRAGISHGDRSYLWSLKYSSKHAAHTANMPVAAFNQWVVGSAEG